jgi:hypothetical protein
MSDRLSVETDRILKETNCSVKICRDIAKDGKLQVIIGADETQQRAKKEKARKIINELLVEFLNDEGSNGRLLYELMANLDGSASKLSHAVVGTRANGFVRQGYNGVLVWMKLLELPYPESGSCLLHPDVQKELTCGTCCSVDVYGFGNKTPSSCDPYVLIRARQKKEVNIVAERVTVKLHTLVAGMRTKFQEEIEKLKMLQFQNHAIETEEKRRRLNP